MLSQTYLKTWTKSSMKKKNKYKIFSTETDKDIDAVLNEEATKDKDAPVKVKSAGAFCSLVKSFCKPLNCETCVVLQEEYPRGIWLCSVCIDSTVTVYSFWGDVPCSKCGFSGGVKALCQKKKTRKKGYTT